MDAQDIKTAGQTGVVVDLREAAKRHPNLRAVRGDSRARYRDIVVGFEFLNLTEADFEALRLEFETALGHLQACRNCRASHIEKLPEKEATEYVRYEVKDCRLNPPGFWYGLSEAGCRATGRPVFSYHNCDGPAARMEALTERWRWKGGEER